MIARSAGLPDLDALLTALAPALVDASPRREVTVLVVGTGQTAERIIRTLAESGVRVLTAPDAATAERAACNLAVAVGHFVLSPELRGLWLRRDIPHLPVVYSDTGAVVGPLVVAGSTPCLYCLDHHARDADAAWPAIAAQLWGRRSAAETPLTSREVAVIACRAVLDWAHGLDAGAASARLDAATGAVSRQEWAVHPDCGCSVPGGNGSAAVRRRDPAPRRPRTARASPPVNPCW
jgi:bacteriocin biosynthesis cyclodehydratase domain-containing protein